MKSHNLTELVSKYMASAEHALADVKFVENPPSLDANDIRTVVEAAKSYLKDAKYYRDKKKFEVSLASVTYCEGLLDALRLLGAVKFEWPVKKKKRKIVLASGTFDLLHLGHVKYLEEAKRTGGRNAELIVIVARDSTVEERRGTKPIIPENQRRALVGSLKVVDEAILGYEDFDIGNVIEKIKPDIITLGYDRGDMERDVRNYVEEKGLTIKVVKIGKFEEEALNSSSKIKQKIIKHYKR